MRRASPSSVGDIASSLRLQQPQLVLLNLAANFINFTNFQLSTDTHPHSGRTSPLHDKGHTTAKAARWGTEKKGVKERTGLPLQNGAFSHQPAGHVFPWWLLSEDTAGRGGP
ncbi:hypothetical protein BREVNS_0670 [Brevinematales bacterium NS]|nr:hypothetical protein BREVNS_0670 [Brevinematales bacterium NS]